VIINKVFVDSASVKIVWKKSGFITRF